MPRNPPLTETLISRPSAVETVLLAASAATPLLPAPWGALALVVLAALWWRRRPSRRELAVALPALALAAVLLAAGWLASRPDVRTLEAWDVAATRQYGRLWAELDDLAREAREAVGRAPVTRAERQAAFARLAEVATPGGTDRASVLLVDPDGEASAWSGSGLLHEPTPEELPPRGRHFRAGFTAVTLMVIEPLDDSRRPWRVVAGRSFPTDRLPFPPPGGEADTDFRWSVVEETRDPAGAEGLRLAPALLPAMVITPRPLLARGLAEASPIWGRAAWAALAAALLAVVVLRGVGLLLTGGARGSHAGSLTALALAGTAAAASAAGAPGTAVAALGLGVLLAALGLAWQAPEMPPWATAVAGGSAALAVGFLAWLFQEALGPLDLGSDLWAGTEVFCLRLAAGVAAFGLLALAGRRRKPSVEASVAGSSVGGGGHALAWWAAGLLLLASLAADRPPIALLLLALSGVAIALWLAHRRLLAEAGSFAAFVALAWITGAVGWEVAYRQLLRLEVERQVLPRLAPPSSAEMDAVASEVSGFLDALDLESLTARPLDGMDRRDLAYAVWRQSPLARRSALSAVKLVPADPEVLPSLGAFPERTVFSFGLPLSDAGEAVWEPASSPDPVLPAWDDLLVNGEVRLTAGGRPWGTARWWLVPRPGFGLGRRESAEQVVVGLLRGAPGDPQSAIGLPEPVLYALYPGDGRPLVSPWQDEPPAPAPVVAGDRFSGLVETPEGPTWAFARRGADGYEALYLPRLQGLEAPERVGTAAATALLFVAVATLIALLLALPRPAFRDLVTRAVRSYSRRLLLVFTALLVVPFLLLDLVLLRTVEASLSRDQEARGEQAIVAAQQAALATIAGQEPGFGIDTALSTEYLKDLSRLVDHDVNVYFGSAFLSSSSGELFTAGLLPRRIPGEVYARLALEGYGIAERTSRAVDTPYLELYRPMALPGAAEGEADEPRIFLSVPLLAQQEEAAGVLAGLRRRVVVATTSLFALLIAVGGRLARNFTKPLQELVEGTRRIAAGAPSLDLAPSDLELAALVKAVDEMARRIARSRGELLREKAVVERMVESITSGVVSLDARHRVVMHNRVAAELLGVAIGDQLEQVAAARERLRPLSTFLASLPAASDGNPRRETVRFGGFAGGEREWTLVWVPLPAVSGAGVSGASVSGAPAEGSGEPAALLVVEDVTEVFRGQRLAAWAEMARMIAHEIKNPLTPIRLSAEHMRQVRVRDPEHFDEIFERCTTNILHQVDELQQIASEFSTYSRIPRIEVREGDLRPALAALVEGYRAAPPPGLEVAGTLPAEPVVVRFDERLLSRAVRNLLENAVRAASATREVRNGGRVELTLEAQPAAGEARLAVLDTGPGVAPDLLPRIFDPYFSTHDTGTGLGLPIARRIVEEHGGTIAARNRPGGGLEVEIRIPLA